MENPVLPNPELRLTVSQKTAAKMLDVCVDTVEAMVARGQLERVRLSERKYGIPMRSILKLIGEAE
jgi:transposase